jgi:hypothetical protein
VNSATLLSHYEHCDLKGFYSRDWELEKLDPNDMLQIGIRAGLRSPREDFHIAAGEECYQLGAERGVDSKQLDVHSQVVHISALADIITYTLRKQGTGPWDVPDVVRIGDGPHWVSGAFLDPTGSFLRRVVLVTAWSDDRHYHEARSYQTLGEVCVYGLPMQEAVIILGQHRDGKRHGPLSKGLLHPANKKLRFRKRNKVAEGFKDSWIPIWREDRDEISTGDWLQAMHEDAILAETCFSVTVPVPEKQARQKVLDLAARKLERLAQMTNDPPDQNLSTCDWPSVCLYRGCCHAGKEPKAGLYRISD